MSAVSSGANMKTAPPPPPPPKKKKSRKDGQKVESVKSGQRVVLMHERHVSGKKCHIMHTVSIMHKQTIPYQFLCDLPLGHQA